MAPNPAIGWTATDPGNHRFMTSQIIPVEAFDYVVFGGTGDLAERKLIPALYRRFSDGQILKQSRIIGAARGEMDHAAYRAFARTALETHVNARELEGTLLATFLDMLFYAPIDAKSDKGWPELKALLGDDNRVRAFYLAVGPAIFGDIADRLHSNGMVSDSSRLVIEKPIGKDLKSAHLLNEAVGRHFREDQIFRIDRVPEVPPLTAKEIRSMLYFHDPRRTEWEVREIKEEENADKDRLSG